MREDASLKHDFSESHKWERVSAWTIVTGLVAEILILLFFADVKHGWETFLMICATVIIALGVAGEIHFSRKAEMVGEELQRISDEKVAGANERATIAQLELQRLKTPRSLSIDSMNALVAALHPSISLLKGRVDFASADDVESRQYAQFFMMIFGGLEIIPGGGMPYGHSPRPISFTGFVEEDIVLDNTDFSAHELNTLLFNAFESIGLSVRNFAVFGTPKGRVTVIIPPRWLGDTN